MKMISGMLGVLALVGLAATVAGQPAPQLAANEKGDYLYHACKAIVKQMDDNSSGEPSPEWRYCAGYMDGFISSHQWYETTKAFCFDVNSSNGVLIRLYVQYMEKNPKLMDAPTAVGVAYTLRDNYPCKGTK